MDKKLTSENPLLKPAGNRKKTFRAPITWDADSLARDLFLGATIMTSVYATAGVNKNPQDIFEALYALRIESLDFAKKKFVKK